LREIGMCFATTGARGEKTKGVIFNTTGRKKKKRRKKIKKWPLGVTEPPNMGNRSFKELCRHHRHARRNKKRRKKID